MSTPTENEPQVEENAPLLCKVARYPPPEAAINNSGRLNAFARNSLRWTPGTTIEWTFVPGGGADTPTNRQIVRDAWKKWADTGLNLKFKEVSSRKAHIRISFYSTGPDSGSWSAVGTDNLRPDVKSQPSTMNIGWESSGPNEGTAEHEIGHALGLDHEHQHPNCPLVWNTTKSETIYEYFYRTQRPRWSKQDVDFQIINRVQLTDSQSTKSVWDSKSIMHYSFIAQLISGPSPYNRDGIRPNYKISDLDVQTIRQMYPPTPAHDTFPTLEPFQSIRPRAQPGQDLFYKIAPETTANYKIETLGKDVDSILVLDQVFTQDNIRTHHQLVADNTAGFDRASSIKAKLIAGQEYVLKFRLVYQNPASPGYAILLAEDFDS